MESYQKICKHPMYKAMLENINKAEIGRKFCLHGIEHALDTARIAYIICLEEKLNISKNVIYSAALLHDIGRYSDNGAEHNEVGAKIAKLIMKDCGFTHDEIQAVSDAVLCHRRGGKSLLGDLLYRADKLSRICFSCKAQNDCYWSTEKRNNVVFY